MTEVEEKLAFVLDGEGKIVKVTIEKMAADFPSNMSLQLLVKHLEKVNSLSREERQHLLDIVKSGLLRTDSGIGLYAQEAADYKNFDYIMKEAWLKYNKRDPACEDKHVNAWELPAGADTKLPGGRTGSLRIRTARNFQGVPFMAQMDADKAKSLELDCQAVFEKFSLAGTGVDYGVEATIYTLTKGHPKDGQRIANEGAIPVTYKYVEFRSDEYYELKKKGIFPPAPIDDHHLMAGGIAGGFPDGRCTYELATPDDVRRMRIYVNEEDHMRIQGMNKSGTDIGTEFKDFAVMINKLASDFKDHVSAHFGGAGALAFARDDTMGFLASCPSNNGTGMRISAQLGFPNLVKKAAAEKSLTYDPNMPDRPGDAACDANKEHGVEILDELNKRDELKSNSVQLRGKGGEGTGPGTDAYIVDMSYKLRTFVTEADIAQKLIDSVSLMYQLEDAAST